MRFYDTYRLTSFDCTITHDFKANNDTEAIEKCKEYDMPPRSQLYYVKDSGKLHGVTFVKWIG